MSETCVIAVFREAAGRRVQLTIEIGGDLEKRSREMRERAGRYRLRDVRAPLPLVMFILATS